MDAKGNIPIDGSKLLALRQKCLRGREAIAHLLTLELNKIPGEARSFSSRHLYNLETGRTRTVRPSTFAALLRVYGISADQIGPNEEALASDRGSKPTLAATDIGAKDAAHGLLRNEPQLLETGLSVKLLQLYYPDSDLGAQNLFRYSYSVDGRAVITNIVRSDQWLELALPIVETDHERFPILEPPKSWVPVSAAAIDRLHAELKDRGVIFHNKPIYCLRSFDPEGQHTIASFSMAQYADYKIKLGRLEEETARALEYSAFSAKAAFNRRRSLMPIRQELLPNCRTIANYTERLCPGGTNVLLAMRRPEREDFTFYVKRRSEWVSTGKNLLSAVPSGTHQPVTLATAREETSVAATVYRETWEELFGGQEVEGEDEHYKPLWFMSKPELAWFRNNPSGFKLEVVSFGLNLMDGTFEFGVLLAITDPSYWEQFAKGIIPNKEFKDSETPPFETTDKARLASILTEPQCADTSLIALVEGLRRLQELEPSRVTLPKIEISK